MRWDRYPGRDVIPLWVADTDFRAPPCVIEALRQALHELGIDRAGAQALLDRDLERPSRGGEVVGAAGEAVFPQ